MIEARLDLDELRKVQHNVLHAIDFIKVLKAAGIPVIGNIVMNGVERGRLEMHREQDMDGDIIVVRWFDHGETILAGSSWRKADFGNGKGYSWIRFEDSSKPVEVTPKSDPDDWDEDEDY